MPLQQNASDTEVSSAFKSFTVSEAVEFRVALFIQQKDLSSTTVNGTPGCDVYPVMTRTPLVIKALQNPVNTVHDTAQINKC